MPGTPELESYQIVHGSTIIDSIVALFNLPDPSRDTYEYAQESSSVTLLQAQKSLEAGGSTYQYMQASGIVKVRDHDIDAYVSLFQCSTDTEKALASFLSNAKKETPRRSVAEYLASRRLKPHDLRLTKCKTHANPYFDLWVLCCRDLGFLGPLGIPSYADPRAAKQSHPLLPIFMHHFGCAVPSYEALLCIKSVSAGRTVLDVGCGNGYWTALLRRLRVDVVATDDCSSTWRHTWVQDIVKADAVQFLRKRDTRQDVLLLVYPITGHHLTPRILQEFAGDVIVIVGTQNANRYTTFPDVTTEQFFDAKPEWEVSVRIAIPSFPGKDDALYVVKKKEKMRL